MGKPAMRQAVTSGPETAAPIEWHAFGSGQFAAVHEGYALFVYPALETGFAGFCWSVVKPSAGLAGQDWGLEPECTAAQEAAERFARPRAAFDKAIAS